MSNITRFRSRQIIHDWAHEDRRQLLLHTKVTPLLREMIDREEERSRLESLVWSLFVGFCGALVAVVILLTHLGVIE